MQVASPVNGRSALLSALPLLLGAGEGSELRRPLGVAILGGLLTSPFLTLFSTPVVYLLVEGLRAKLSRLRAIRPEVVADRP